MFRLDVDPLSGVVLNSAKRLQLNVVLEKALNGTEFADRINSTLQRGRDVLHVAGNNKPIEHIAICTGGLGPTADDLTRHAIAASMLYEKAIQSC